MSIKPILKESFYHDGRGPELKQVHYANNGVILKAINYFNPDDEYTPENLKHLLFLRPQVFMFTPEEVLDYTEEINWGEYNNAAIVCLGKSKWLESFSPRHLDKCLHYQVMFYDEFLDVICEGIEAKSGGFNA
jgi:hypothetical protein